MSKNWRSQMLNGLQNETPKKSSRQKNAEAKRIRVLEKEPRRMGNALAETAALLVLKKSPGNLGGRGRLHSRKQREMVIKLIDRAIDSGARLEKAAAIMGLSARTIIRWRRRGGGQDQRKSALTAPAN